jgi:outer membrane receptor for ferrienterochelin and colicins
MCPIHCPKGTLKANPVCRSFRKKQYLGLLWLVLRKQIGAMKCFGCRFHLGWVACVLLLCWQGTLFGQVDSLGEDDFSLDSLLNVQISSVAKYAQSTQEAPASVTIISKEDIYNYGYNDIGELLNAVRDLYITFDRNYTYLGVRGYGRPTDYNNRVAVMVNGVVLNENLWGAAPIGTELFGFNIDMVERVEVIRGPASALYGNYPMLGMINIVTQTGKSLDGVKVSVEQGSYGKWQGSVGYAHSTAKGLDISVGGRLGKLQGQQLYYPEYDDSSTNNGIADKLDGNTWSGLNARLAYRNWTVQGFVASRTIHVPTAAYSSDFADPRFVVTDRYAFLESEYARDISPKTAVFAKAWLYNYYDRGAYPLDSADGGYQRDGVDGLWLGGEARMRHDLTGNNRLVVGIDGQRIFKADYFIRLIDTLLYDFPVSYTTFAAFAQDEYQPIKQLSITAGLRLDVLYLGKIALTPRVAVNLFASKTATFKFLYGWAFRAPNAYEANINDPTFIKGNLNLKPETIHNLEIVYEQKLGKHQSVAASVFRQNILQVIDQVLDPTDSLLQYQNIENSGGFGGSAEWNGRFQYGLHAYGNYSFADMRNQAGNLWLTNSPRHMCKAGLSVPFLKHFRFSPEAVVQSGRLTVYDSETAAFAYLSAQLLVAPHLPGRAAALNRCTLAFKVRNLLDTAYFHPGGFEHQQAAIQQNGRNYNLKLQVNLF